MLQQIRNNYSKNELSKIAKIIQMRYKYNLAGTFRKAFNAIGNLVVIRSDRIELWDMIENSINPSNKLFDSVKAKEILVKSGFYRDNIDYQRIEYLSRFKLPAIQSIINELNGLVSEYGGFNFDRDHLLTIESGPFVIQNVDFGRFQITFNIKHACIFEYDHIPTITAVTPKYPPGDGTTTHPHVRGRQPCLGQGKVPLRKSMSEGRLLDSFTIVSSVLNTYSNDPFVRIEAWTGHKCRDCGRYYNPDGRAECSKCAREYCAGCISQCCDASTRMCNRCRHIGFACNWCGVRLCCECVEPCNICKRQLCSNHVQKESHRCV